VHRLDKDTSGLLLVGKTPQAHLALSRQLKARSISRRYLALVEGLLPLNAGTVKAPLGRHRIHRKVMAVRQLDGRVAVTHYRVLKRFSGGAEGRRQGAGTPLLPCTLVEVSLETGRTHQIRVHMAHLGHPVVGDAVYGRRPASFWQQQGVRRQLLHAYQLTFYHPVTKQPLTLQAPAPPDLARWCEPDLLRAGVAAPA
jgi:23S rRNA pseudouridine1911/1915/1917 synthase